MSLPFSSQPSGGQAPSSSPETPTPAPSPVPPPAAERQRNYLPWLLLVLLGLGVGYVVLQRTQQSAVGTVSLRTGVVSQGDLQRVMTVSGTISAKESAAIIAPRMRQRGGSQDLVIVAMPEAGSYIKAGDLVVEFDRERMLNQLDDEQAQVVQAQANVDKANAARLIALDTQRQAVQTAKASMDKANLDLRTVQVRSEIEAEKLRLAALEAEAMHKQAEEEYRLTEISQDAQVRALELTLEETRLDYRRSENNSKNMMMRSPIDGLVVMMPIVQRNSGEVNQIRTGDEVRPGTFFMQVVDTSEMILTGTINQVDSQNFRVGQQAEIRLDAYPEAVFPGRLASVGALATTGGSGGFSRGGRDDYVRRVQAAFVIDAVDERIIPDLSASARVIIGSEKDVVLAPREGIWEEAGKFFAYLQESAGNSFTKREVQAGTRSTTQVAILAGLQPGDRIALSKPPQR